MKVGQRASLTRRVSAEDVETFARLTGDENPVHLDDAYAATTRFGKRIAHGVFSAGLISAVLGTKLPGPGAVYLHQSLDFKKPVYLGDMVTAEVVVAKLRPDKPIVTLETRCTNQEGEVVLSGEAVLFVEALRDRGAGA